MLVSESFADTRLCVGRHSMYALTLRTSRHRWHSHIDLQIHTRDLRAAILAHIHTRAASHIHRSAYGPYSFGL